MGGCAAVLCVVLALASAGPLYVGKRGTRERRALLAPLCPRSAAACLAVAAEESETAHAASFENGQRKKKKAAKRRPSRRSLRF